MILIIIMCMGGLSSVGVVLFCPLLVFSLFCFPPARGQSHRGFLMYAAHTAAASTATTATASLPHRMAYCSRRLCLRTSPRSSAVVFVCLCQRIIARLTCFCR